MSTGIILTISFLVEAILLAVGTVVFLIIRLKKLKARQATIAAEAEGGESGKTLMDFFEDQITRTRKEIAGQKQEELDKDQKAHKELLNKRIDYLNFEKEISGEHVTDKDYWGKIYNHLSSILAINITSAESDTPHDQDSSSNKSFFASVAVEKTSIIALLFKCA